MRRLWRKTWFRLLVYAVALGTHWGLHADERAFPTGTGGPTWERAHVALRRAVDTIHVATVILAAGAAAAAALWRRRFDLAAVAIATLTGANLTTHLLKPLLAHADPLLQEGAALVADLGQTHEIVWLTGRPEWLPLPRKVAV